MVLNLPAYEPPSAQRAGVAGGVSPIIALVVFTLLVSHVIDAETAFAWFLGCTVWVVYELHDYQRQVDHYNVHYVERHLVWRSNETLRSIADSEATPYGTREFVRRFLDAGRVLLRDGPTLF